MKAKRCTRTRAEWKALRELDKGETDRTRTGLAGPRLFWTARLEPAPEKWKLTTAWYVEFACPDGPDTPLEGRAVTCELHECWVSTEGVLAVVSEDA